MINVQSFPQGLRELLGRGDPPQRLRFHPETTLPVIDITDFLLLQQRSTAVQAELVAVTGGACAITVPDGELWALQVVTVTTDTLDGDQATIFQPRILVDGQHQSSPTVTALANLRGVGNFPLNSGWRLILRPGDVIDTFVSVATVGAAGAIDYSCRVLFSRLAG